jgi:hypothetical protein
MLGRELECKNLLKEQKRSNEEDQKEMEKLRAENKALRMKPKEEEAGKLEEYERLKK